MTEAQLKEAEEQLKLSETRKNSASLVSLMESEAVASEIYSFIKPVVEAKHEALTLQKEIQYERAQQIRKTEDLLSSQEETNRKMDLLISKWDAYVEEVMKIAKKLEALL